MKAFLERDKFPPLSEFTDNLHGGRIVIDEALYNRSRLVFETECKNMYNYLEKYTTVDTVSFLDALIFYMQIVREKLNQNLTDFVTLPGLSEKYFYQESDIGFMWLPRRNSKSANERTDIDLMLYRDLKNDALGGLSCTYNRVGLRGVTVTNVDSVKREPHACVEGFDFVR